MRNFSLTLDEFKIQSKLGNSVPLYKEVVCDTETPVTLFAKWGCEQAEYSFLLESVEKGDRVGRYSFIGKNPRTIFSGKDKHFVLEENKIKKEVLTNDPLKFFEEYLSTIKHVSDPNLPSFQGGPIGFISYSAIRYYESIPDSKKEIREAPDLYFGVFDEILIVDHIEHKLKILINVSIESDNLENLYEVTKLKIENIHHSIIKSPIPQSVISPKKLDTEIQFTPNISDEEFKNIVKKAKSYIYEGDIFQVVPSRILSFESDLDPFLVYRALRIINPSPYMYFLKIYDLKIVGSSPEILVKIKSNIATLRPLAGTRPRGESSEIDIQNEIDLLDDPKEVAEHVMLVDLGRNDLGRVCKPGSVRVKDFKIIEKYSHVMHIVSQCVGELDTDKNVFDLIKSSLPAGTLSGAPKIRAMEIIDELEPIKRTIYSGALGYISYQNEADLAIIIRTIVFYNKFATIQAGCGVVMDSIPEDELQETKNKMAAMLKAIELAKNGLMG